MIGCDNGTPSQPNQTNDNTLPVPKKSVAVQDTVIPQSPSTVPPPPEFTNQYAWIADYNTRQALEVQIPVPTGYQRIPAAKQSITHWLRGLPLYPKGTKVLLYDGNTKPYQDGAARVINIDIGKRDLQQCADAVMRLKAEYHYAQKEYDAIHFNYTSGDNIRFSDWSKGRKPSIKGKKVVFSSSSGNKDYSYKNFKKYLTNVYCYAGTASLSKELESKAIHDIEAGDVFIWGGFPGHAILVVDVAVHQETGKKIFLLAQSYMPAQSIHILKNFNDSDLSPWYHEDFGSELLTPEWTFSRDALKTFK